MKTGIAINTGGKPIKTSSAEERKKWESNLQADIDLELKRQQESIERLSLELLKQISGKI